VTRTQIFDVLKTNIRTVMPHTKGLPILESSSMRDLGGNSLEAANVLSLCMHQLGIEVPIERCMKTSNLAGLLDLLEAELRRR
jgi:acyl carrier protein